MRTLAVIILTLICIPVFAAHVNCYSDGKTIYSGEAKDVYYDSHALILHNRRPAKDIFIFGGECIVKL